MGFVNKILVVDDDQIDRMTVRKAIDTYFPNAIYEEAITFDDGVRKLAQSQYDCVITDFKLPDATGLDLISYVMQSDMPRKPGLILFTGHGDEKTAVEAMKIGASDYLVKDDLTSEQVYEAVMNSVASVHKKRDEIRKDFVQKNFVGMVTHDLKSPMASILGYLELILREENLPPHIREYAANGMEGAKHLDGVISTFWDYAVSGTADSLVEAVPISELLNTTQIVLNKEIDSKNASITLVGDPELTINASRMQMLMLLQNLIGNALKYNDAPQPKIVIQSTQTDHGVRLEIADNGIGIPEDKYEDIFLPLTQINPDKRKGMGLGLAICRNIVEKHHGRIWCTPSKLGGSTFFVELPNV